jgi:hypothetical protein
VLLPAKHFAGSKLDISLLTWRSCTATKGADAGKIRRERGASGVAEDAENAPRARMPEERVMISWFKM